MKRASALLVFLLLASLLTACGPGEAPVDEARQQQLAQIVIAYGQTLAQDQPCAPCDQAPPATTAQLPPVNPGEITGDIIVAGSSTVFPLAERMAERFRAEGYRGNITIDSIGSGAGFERFCTAGETDISNASRPIKEEEIEHCRKIGREPVTFRVGTDALAVVVNPENDWVQNLSMEQLAAAFATAATWSDINPDWPDEPIQRFIPGTDSGTFDYFVEEVFAKDPKPILSASHLQMSEDDNVLVQGVEGEKYAIGFFGYAFYSENQDRLRVISINGVAPNREHVDDGSYPLARPLFMYSAPSIMQAKSQVAAFLDFILTYVNDEIVDVGYFPASDQALAQSRQNWLNAMGR
ncbi:MAG TPA: PstS family phosphate ABC transporter substrate-binding protein [Anaerolineae bacterium]|nr:PstS family phosphate ABC transporter substrate-binding protein [Anaerolineae bacterium]HIQ12528.1 PstS family phosphate ABC transporter substrate-binding protein [Caldilineales bacterium]